MNPKKHFLQRETTLFVANVLLIFFFSPDVAFLMRKMAHIPIDGLPSWFWYSSSALVLEVVILLAVANGSESTGKVISIASFFLSNYYYLFFDGKGEIITKETFNTWLVLPSITLSAYRAIVIYNMAGIWSKIRGEQDKVNLPDPKLIEVENRLSETHRYLNTAKDLAKEWKVKYYEAIHKSARSEKAKKEIETILEELKTMAIVPDKQ